MIEISEERLVFRFPEVHPGARLDVSFLRTLRVPDDGRTYFKPAGLGRFPLVHVDDFAAVPESWKAHGGVMLPIHRSEALYLSFNALRPAGENAPYPFAVKVACGKINALTGGGWDDSLPASGQQDYAVVPDAFWLDGYLLPEGRVRQFVARPLGSGRTMEERLDSEAFWGGIQVAVFPMKAECYEKRFSAKGPDREARISEEPGLFAPDMGLAGEGRMTQRIRKDPFGTHEWEEGAKNRCFIHLADASLWRRITGQAPPTRPITRQEYEDAGLPWIESEFASGDFLPGSEKFEKSGK